MRMAIGTANCTYDKQKKEDNPLRGASNTAPMGLKQATGYAGGHDFSGDI